MKRISIAVIAMAFAFVLTAETFRYRFSEQTLADALTLIAEEHPTLNLNFIYNELDKYLTSATVDTSDPEEAIYRTIGANPVSVLKRKNRYYVEAHQRGKFLLTGRTIDIHSEPVPRAIVMILAPNDSTVITYGMTDESGYFSIPCDRMQALAKAGGVGYRPTFSHISSAAPVEIVMEDLPIQLNQISVEAQSSYLASDKNSYIPSQRQKKSAQDAIDLLRRMAIPQLLVSPATNSVTDLFGNSVQVYINYSPADRNDLAGMNMTDVLKVEYYEYPSDPRFIGEAKVVNFILQVYEYGGYTKVSATERALNGFYNAINIFSKFTYKKLTYDLFAGSTNQNYHHNGIDTETTYKIVADEKDISVKRSETNTYSHEHTDLYPLTLRATYTTDRLSVRNSLFYSHKSTPTQEMGGDLHVDMYPDNDYRYTRSTPSRYNRFSYHGNLWAMIGDKISVDVTPTFNYTHNNNLSAYTSTLSTPIDNTITEDAYNWGLQATGRRSFGRSHQVTINLSSSQNINKLEYRGTSVFDDSYSIFYIGGIARYNYQAKKTSLSAFVGFANEHSSMNRLTDSDFSPRGGINARYQFDIRNQISASAYFQSFTPGIGMRANDIIKSNEFLYLTANPYLKNVRNLISNLSYNRFCSNALSLAVFAGYEEQFDRIATIYKPYLDGTSLLRDFINDGNRIKAYLGASANCKLLDNSLQLYANISQNIYYTTGLYRNELYPFRIQLQASYYWKTFNAMVYWSNPNKTLTDNSNIIIRERSNYGISIGWGNGIWTLSLDARNIFNRGWLSSTWDRSTPLYSEHQRYYNAAMHPNLTLSATYTIGYGKRIRRTNEIGEFGGTQSAIMK